MYACICEYLYCCIGFSCLIRPCTGFWVLCSPRCPVLRQWIRRFPHMSSAKRKTGRPGTAITHLTCVLYTRYIYLHSFIDSIFSHVYIQMYNSIITSLCTLNSCTASFRVDVSWLVHLYWYKCTLGSYSCSHAIEAVRRHRKTANHYD